MLLKAFLFLDGLALPAEAREPDLQTRALVRPYGALAGPLSLGGPDALLWVEQDTRRLYKTETSGAELVTSLVAQDVLSVLALADYDGDSWANIIGSPGGSTILDVSTLQIFDIADCDVEGIGDVNGDGYDDLASPFEIWLGSPSGFSVGGSLYAAEDVVSCPTIYPLGDIDADGRADFARASVDISAPPSMAPRRGSLDLYLGADYDEPAWPLRWRYMHETHSAGRAVTAADVDADGTDELVAIAANDSDALVQGEILILDNLLDPLGPTVISFEPLGEYVTNRNGVYLQNMGDLDEDGDEEVLAVMQNLVGGGFVALIDAETWAGGLLRSMGEGFSLPLPAGAELESELAAVGDYDGDGLRDVAMTLAWTTPAEDEFALDGTIALWLSTVIEHEPDPVFIEDPEPAEETAEAAERTVERGCSCNISPASGSLMFLLPLLALCSRKSRSGISVRADP